jgi:hypothetical protein
MSETSATTHAEQSEAPPPFQPDPELIDHLEGNRRAIKRYRRAAEKQRDDAQESRSLG